jgi:hypothetical protein
MSFDNYILSIDISVMPLEAILMAYMRKADYVDLHFMINKYPNIYEELKTRYTAPGGKLEGEE